MTSDRPYRRALPLAEALGELDRNAGAQFDPVVVGALVRVLARGTGGPAGYRAGSLPTKTAFSEPDRNGSRSISTDA
jgi:HD-GYP domain-containing protein (c-di-GMP phosphodiesterase class II)